MISTSPIAVVDTHAHLDEIEDVEACILRAKDAGVTAIVAVGSNSESNQRTLDLASRYPAFVLPALGLHPWEIGKLDPAGLDATVHFIEANIERSVGIGEIGLDYNKRVLQVSSKELQWAALKRLLQVAKAHDKPAMLHSRYAWKDTFELTWQAGVPRAVFHWYTGFSSVLRDIISAGYFVSATPAAEYHHEHQRAIKETPLDLLLLETDSPVTYGRDNPFKAEPADALRSLQAVAALVDLPASVLAERTTRNASLLLGIHLGGEKTGK